MTISRKPLQFCTLQEKVERYQYLYHTAPAADKAHMLKLYLMHRKMLSDERRQVLHLDEAIEFAMSERD